MHEDQDRCLDQIGADTTLVSIPIADSCMRDIAVGPTCTEKSVAVSG